MMSIYVHPFITIYACVTAFVFGAVFGSFFGCLAYRICKGEAIVKGRSHCEICGHVLGFFDLIPIVSYLVRRGHCKYCGKKISPICLWGEVILAILFVLCTLKFDNTLYLILVLFFVSILYIITLTDLQDCIIPNRCIAAAVLVRVLYFLITKEGNFRQFLWLLTEGLFVSVPVLLLVLFVEAILRKEAFGGGDIKLLFVLGLYLGLVKCLLMLLVACVLSIIGRMLAIKKSGVKGSVVFPFGPYLATGSVVALLFGDSIMSWHLFSL